LTNIKYQCTTHPSDFGLAYVVAPNIDFQAHLRPRIVGESDDLAATDLLFLAMVVGKTQETCSQSIGEMRTRCSAIRRPERRDEACSFVDEIEGFAKR
jgi:hypothetical protein